jgi:hypothetical protein
MSTGLTAAGIVDDLVCQAVKRRSSDPNEGVLAGLMFGF